MPSTVENFHWLKEESIEHLMIAYKLENSEKKFSLPAQFLYIYSLLTWKRMPNFFSHLSQSLGDALPKTMFRTSAVL